MYQKVVKPFFDFTFSLIGLLLLSPVFILIMVCLFIVNKGKPFFFQDRVGKNGNVFKIIKFKTMNDFKNENNDFLEDDLRKTKFGNFIRKTSLDELPQLINVLKGEMSFVGPRPLLTNYFHMYSQFQNQRHLVQSGITGLVQVSGRNSISWEKRFELDVFYAKNCSFILDFKILMKTVFEIFKFKNSNHNKFPIEPFEV